MVKIEVAAVWLPPGLSSHQHFFCFIKTIDCFIMLSSLESSQGKPFFEKALHRGMEERKLITSSIVTT